MRISEQDIKSINKKRTAKVGVRYYTSNGFTYVGQQNGSLLLYTESNTNKKKDFDISNRLTQAEKDIDDVEEEILLKDYITDVDTKLSKLECKLIAMSIVL